MTPSHSCRDSGAAHHERDVGRFLVGSVLCSVIEPVSMLPHVGAVVCGEDDVCIGQLAPALKFVQYGVDRIIYAPERAELVALPVREGGALLVGYERTVPDPLGLV